MQYLRSSASAKDNIFLTSQLDIAGLPVVAIKGKGIVRKAEVWENTLYKPFTPEYDTADFTAIPYFAWANRGETT